MTATAIAVLVGSLTVVWGGLAASTLYLRRHPEEAEQAEQAESDPRTDEPIVTHDL